MLISEINKSLPRGYYLTEEKGYYFLRKIYGENVLEFYKKEEHILNNLFLDNLNKVIQNHEELHSSKRLKSINESSSDNPYNNLENYVLYDILDRRGLKIIK